MARRTEPYHLTVLGELYGSIGQIDRGLALLAEALGMMQTNGERWYEAEAQRLTGELLLQHSPPDVRQAETCLQQALALARQQGAKSWELRSTISLSRLWQHQGKRDAARQLLSAIYGWFTEGFDTADLRAAQGLLEELGV